MKNINKVWNGIRLIISHKPKKPSSPSSIIINGLISSDSMDIANSFNQYFGSVAEKIRKKIPKTPKTYTSFLKNPIPNSLFLSPVDTNEILNCISTLDYSKATGPTSIPSRILPLIKAEIADPLANIINLCFVKGIFPEKIKLAKIIPVFKKGPKLECSNYRPISLLSNLDKKF